MVEYVDLLKSSYIDSFRCYDKLKLLQWPRSWLLVLNEVSDSYLTLWIHCYLSVRNHVTKHIYVAIIRMIMMPSCPYFILSTPLSLNMWKYLSLSASAWGQARSKLDTSILHHPFISIFIAFWAVITRYVTILMPILSYFTRFTWRGRMSTTGILGWKRRKY